MRSTHLETFHDIGQLRHLAAAAEHAGFYHFEPALTPYAETWTQKTK